MYPRRQHPLFPEWDGACTAPECQFLCHHMYKCDSQCYDFNNGHICKHIHRVHSLSLFCDKTGSSNEPQQMSQLTQPLSASEMEDCDILDDSFTEISYAESVFDPKKGWTHASQKHIVFTSKSSIVILSHRSQSSAQHI